MNQRRQCRQIYSLLPLTTRPPVHICGGEGEIRTHGTFPYDSFQDCSLNPLGHFSVVAENGVKPFQTWTQFHAVLLCNIGSGSKSRTYTRRAYETRVSAIWTIPLRSCVCRPQDNVLIHKEKGVCYHETLVYYIRKGGKLNRRHGVCLESRY